MSPASLCAYWTSIINQVTCRAALAPVICGWGLVSNHKTHDTPAGAHMHIRSAFLPERMSSSSPRLLRVSFISGVGVGAGVGAGVRLGVGYTRVWPTFRRCGRPSLLVFVPCGFAGGG